MKILVIFFLLVTVMAGCTNNPTLTGVNNADTVELKDEFGRDAYPPVPKDSLEKKNSPKTN